MGKDHLPSPDGNTLTQPQDTTSLLCCKGPELAHAHQDSQSPLCQAAFQLDSPQHILVVSGVFPLQMQDLALLLVDLQETPASPFLQAVGLLMDGSMTLWCTSQFTQFRIINKFAPSFKSLMKMFNRTSFNTHSWVHH